MNTFYKKVKKVANKKFLNNESSNHRYLLSWRYVGRTMTTEGDTQVNLKSALTPKVLEGLREETLNIIELREGIKNVNGCVTIQNIFKFEQLNDKV